MLRAKTKRPSTALQTVAEAPAQVGSCGSRGGGAPLLCAALLLTPCPLCTASHSLTFVHVHCNLQPLWGRSPGHRLRVQPPKVCSCSAFDGQSQRRARLQLPALMLALLWGVQAFCLDTPRSDPAPGLHNSWPIVYLLQLCAVLPATAQQGSRGPGRCHHIHLVVCDTAPSRGKAAEVGDVEKTPLLHFQTSTYYMIGIDGCCRTVK